jgi:hypothetical protein
MKYLVANKTVFLKANLTNETNWLYLVSRKRIFAFLFVLMETKMKLLVAIANLYSILKVIILRFKSFVKINLKLLSCLNVDINGSDVTSGNPMALLLLTPLVSNGLLKTRRNP